MTKTIPTTLGILIVLLIAGVAGASVLFYSQEEGEVVLVEETFVEEDEIITEDDPEPEEDEEIEKKDLEIKSVEFNPSLKSRELSDFTYTPGTKMILEIEGQYESVCLSGSPGPGTLPATSPDSCSTEIREENGKTFAEFQLDYSVPDPGYTILCHRLSDFHYIYFFDKEKDLITESSAPIKEYSCNEIKGLISREDEFADWNTYIDKEHGFKLILPEGWDLIGGKPEISHYDNFTRVEFYFIPPEGIPAGWPFWAMLHVDVYSYQPDEYQWMDQYLSDYKLVANEKEEDFGGKQSFVISTESPESTFQSRSLALGSEYSYVYGFGNEGYHNSAIRMKEEIFPNIVIK